MTVRLHLLVTVFITDQGIMRLNTGHLERPVGSRLDLFLTSLFTLTALPWTSGRIHVAFDDSYRPFKSKVAELVEGWFPEMEVLDGRLSNFEEWHRETHDHVPSHAVVLLAANDDHALIPGAAEAFLEIAQAMSNEADPRCLGLVTHFPEVWSLTAAPWTSPGERRHGVLWSSTSEPIGTCLIRQELLSEWFDRDFTGGSKIVRPDNPFGPSVEFESSNCVVPSREVMRHLDGYSHIGIKSPSAPLRATIRLSGASADTRYERDDWVTGEWPQRLRAWRRGSRVDLIRMSSRQPSPARDWRGDVAAIQVAFAHRWNFRHIKSQVPDRGRHPDMYRLAVVGTSLLTPTCLRRAPRFLFDQTIGRSLRNPVTQQMVGRYGWRSIPRRWLSRTVSRQRGRP